MSRRQERTTSRAHPGQRLQRRRQAGDPGLYRLPDTVVRRAFVLDCERISHAWAREVPVVTCADLSDIHDTARQGQALLMADAEAADWLTATVVGEI
ncbi:hypothetical protein [Streptomyces sp. NBC_01235]|uniref:hypothetical protein n=1 Tax=Streptomyces sp. NBC_01235 TaxID=2903788 RepID=UPI002E0FCC03|nr:hypothetical protein OG289_05110 [Streptomyces sp. NBC_01235]